MSESGPTDNTVPDDSRALEFATQALQVSAERRDEFLTATCGDNRQLRDQVQKLIDKSAPDLSGATSNTFSNPSGSLPANFGRQIGPYILGEKVGEGGMGTVYRAEQTETIRRTVAIKVIQGELGSSNVIARFEAERQALARMDHPNIAKILDAGTHAGLPYFVMELVPGSPITRFCDKERLNIRQRLELFIQVCDAIAHAHTKAILHRDIKSSNVLAYLADGKAHAKVIDFGIAKALTDDKLNERLDRTQVGRAMGTYESMSPEQAEGIADIDTRTDVYALGVLLYELLCGFKPFAGKMVPGINEIEVHRIIRDVDPPSPSTWISGEVAKARQTGQTELVKRLRTELEWIPLKACRKERERRYDSVSQLADDVRNYLSGRPLLAGPDSRMYRLKKFTRRNKGPIAAASSVVIALLLGITATTVEMVRETHQRHAAEQAKVEAEQQRDSANAVVSFLTDDVLVQASPGNTFDKNIRDVLVDHLLKPASDKVQKRFAGKPMVEASVRDMLGLIFSELGRSDLALPLMDGAYSLRSKSLKPGDPQLIDTLNNYGLVLSRAGKPDDAESFYKKALAQSQPVSGEDSPETVKLLGNYGEDLRLLGRTDEAKTLFVRALAGSRRLFGNDDIRTLSLQSNYGDLLLQLGNYIEAEGLFFNSWNASRSVAGENDDDTVKYMDHYAMALSFEGRAKEAEPFAYQAWQRRKAGLGEDQPQTIESLHNYACVLQQSGQSVKARPFASKAWSKRDKLLGADAPETRVSLNNLAHVLFSLGEIEKATGCFKDLYQSGLRLYGPDSQETANALRTYAQALKRGGNLTAATPLFGQLWERNQRVLGVNDPETIAACNRFGEALLALQKPEDAEIRFHQAVEAADKNKSMGHGDSRTRQYASNEAACLVRLNRPDDAKAIRKRFELETKTSATQN